MPSDEEIARARSKNKNIVSGHLLDPYREQIEQWHNQGLTSVVIHRLLIDRCSCAVQAIRRYRKKHFQEPREPVMVRTTVAGRDLEVDFGERSIMDLSFPHVFQEHPNIKEVLKGMSNM
jgi:hypothetical protein